MGRAAGNPALANDYWADPPEAPVTPRKVLTPLKAIRSYCVECAGFNRAEVRRCHLNTCPLYPYRMGHRPKKEVPDGV